MDVRKFSFHVRPYPSPQKTKKIVPDFMERALVTITPRHGPGEQIFVRPIPVVQKTKRDNVPKRSRKLPDPNYSPDPREYIITGGF